MLLGLSALKEDDIMEQKHYFTDNRDLPSNRKVHPFTLAGHTWNFMTDDGVFSKTGVDYGTKVLLEAAAREQIAGDVLDMGCGYGVIGIVVRTLFPSCTVVCSDVNPRAAELAEANSRSCDAPVTVIVSDCFESITDSFDVILSNPPIRAGKKTVYAIFEGAYAHLNPHGMFLAVIRKQQGADSAARKLREVFGNCEQIANDKSYRVLKCIREN